MTIPTIFTAVDKYSSVLATMQSRTEKFADSAMNVAKKSLLIGGIIAAPLILAANSAIQFEDRMADVAKTTGLSGKALGDFGDKLLELAPSTRTSIEELQKIAAIGGQMGVAQAELLGFTESVDKFNVALGSDFAGGVEEASKSIAVLRNLFKETRDLKVADAITKTGSAINAISAKGVSVPELTDFVARIGQLPDAIKPTIQATTALGAVMNKAGITSEIAARGVGDILLTASQNLPAFAKQMGATTSAVSKLINEKPEVFLAQFSKSLKGIQGAKLGQVLKGLKLGDTGSIKVVGALGSALEQLTEFQSLSNAEFQKGTSILDEYNVKNNTTAAMLAKAKNSFESFNIILGRELLPTINELLLQVAPMIKSFAAWAKANPGTLATIVKIIAGVAALALAIGAVATVLSAGATMWAGITAGAVFLLPYLSGIWTVTSSLIYGFAFLAGISFGALVAILAAVGAVVYSIYNNWQQLVDAFTNGGFIAGIKMIGAVLLDAILLPLQKILELVGADSWASSIKGLRGDMGLNVTAVEPTNTRAAEQASMQEYISTNNAKVAIDINDPNNRATAKSTSDLVTLRMGSTMSFE